jgi:hypothetical protein
MAAHSLPPTEPGTGSDRAVHSLVVRGSEPVSAELPGDLAAAAGRSCVASPPMVSSASPENDSNDCLKGNSKSPNARQMA